MAPETMRATILGAASLHSRSGGHVTEDGREQMDDDPRKEPLALEGKRYVIREHFAVVVHLALALGAARTFAWNNAWVYAGMILAAKVGSAILLLRVNPAVLNARGTKREMSRRERLFFSFYLPAALAMPVVAGLDVGAAGWTHRSLAELVGGLAIVVLGTSLLVWALAANAFFEPTVRLQRDRGHRVCTTGPYRFVRHPGYAGAVLGAAGVPLLLGSRWCFVPFALMTLAFVVRTAYEDRMLRAELEGYDTYATRTRFRLVPLVW